MENTLVTKGNENNVGRFWHCVDKVKYHGSKILRNPLSKIALLIGGGYLISNNIMNHDYDATAEFGTTKFSLSRNRHEDT